MIYNSSSIAISMITHYPSWYRGQLRSKKHTDKIRGDLAIKTIEEARKRGYHVVVADGQSRKTFRKKINTIDGVVVINRRSMKRRLAKRQAIKKASKIEGVKVIIRTEPEKLSLITDCIEFITKPLLENKADIVVPKRDKVLFKNTYPQYQYESEREGNILYNEILRAHFLIDENKENLDIFFGPIAFQNKPKIISLFQRNITIKLPKNIKSEFFFLNDEYGFSPVVEAIKKKMHVMSVEVPFSYPSLQKQNELSAAKELFMEKRRNQKLSILVDLLHIIRLVKK